MYTKENKQNLKQFSRVYDLSTSGYERQCSSACFLTGETLYLSMYLKNQWGVINVSTP